MQDKPKLQELLATGFHDTGKKYKKVKPGDIITEYPVYALPGDVAGLVYNHDEDKIELVFKMQQPFTLKSVQQSKAPEMGKPN